MTSVNISLENTLITCDPEDIYGYGFHGNTVLILAETEDTMTRYLHITRHGGEDFYRLSADACFSDLPVPDAVYFHTGESWYGTRFADFAWEEHSLRFILYKVKAQYMASAELAEFRLLCSCTGHGNIPVILLQRNG